MSDVAILHEAERLLVEVARRPYRFESHSEYQASNSPIASSIPKHWITKKVKYLAELITGKSDDDFPKIGLEQIESFTGQRVDSATEFDGYGVAFERNDILYGKLRPYLAKVFLADSKGAAVGDFFVLRPRSDQFPRYLQYMLLDQGFTQLANGSTYGAKMPRVDWRFLGNLKFAQPPLDEQQTIATFLDRETAKIDSLVAKKRRLIELLGEKRTALISHAVTKGIDPEAPMKSSGICWLGDVPEHWGGKKLGFIVRMRGGMTPSKANESYWKGAIPWVSPKDMKCREIVDSEDHISESALEETTLMLFEPPVVLMVVRGMILAHTFPVAITRVPVTVNQDMKALMPKPDCNEEYLINLLNGVSHAILGTVDDSAHGTKVLRLPVWKHVGVFMPDEAEQAEICKHIDQILTRFDGLIKKVEAAIVRLNEYRSALISAAVTGQIDVRNYQSEVPT